MNEETKQAIEEGFDRLNKTDFRKNLTYGSPHFKIAVLAELLGTLSHKVIDGEEDHDKVLLKLASFALIWYEISNE